MAAKQIILGKKRAKKISSLITSLMVMNDFVRNDVAAANGNAERSMKWFNDTADELIAMGINVHKFEI